MKILIVNYFYPPIGRAHSFRWCKIANIWAEQGHEITFLTARAESRRNNNIILSEVGARVSADRFDNKQKNSSPNGKGISFKIISKNIYRKFFWPDGLWYWLLPLFFRLFSLRSEKYDYVITYSPTFVSHLGGLFYKIITKEPFDWIAEYGDPFSISDSMPPNNFNLYRRLNYYFEKKVVFGANKVVFTNKETKQAYFKAFGTFNAVVIPHAVDIESFYSNDKKLSSGNIVSLVYVGSFHKQIREPYNAIKYINDLIGLGKKKGVTINFDIYGPSNGIDVHSLCSDNIKYHGPIPRDEAIQKMKNADILVNIENENCVMSPSKEVEYLATGLPILNYYEGEPSGIFQDLQMKYPDHIYNHEYKSSKVKDAFIFINRCGEARWSFDTCILTLKKYDFHEISNKYFI
ncbi:hypothetical protein [Desulfuromonas sp. AOP6]|uniref:hypothetical protein n=1 Tax=Desulfuromonas sp. AOP6 TaxID=1566351 RepID=UPI0012829970|nr:hypothetical protein [Desulfuromonas sp. AOP6]BCA80083.1 hypothetical protein AOP6_1870 [Desulfuromonas sp. AOP6]